MPAAAIPMILTRPDGSNDRFVAALSESVIAALQILNSPLIEIFGLPDVPTRAQTAAIFTSSNGVGLAPHGRGMVAYCVGAATCEAASRAGWTAFTVGQDADGLVSGLIAERPEGGLTHYCGVHTRGQVAERLTAAGLKVHAIPVYDQREMPLTVEAHKALGGSDPVIIPLFSPRTARLFVRQVKPAAPLWIVAMSRQVADEVTELEPAMLRIAAAPTLNDMADALEKLVQHASAG
jgi:uroporphyrinogen-III synthase